MEPAALIASLSSPAAYPFAVGAVEVRQTHISVVFLAGAVAYKVKKGVRLKFLDFSTLDRRRFYCLEEVRLNRRLAPDVYLGVVPVTLEDGHACFEGKGEAIDWAVKMRRLPESATLAARLERGELDGVVVERLAQRVASFHRSTAAGTRTPADFASVAQVVRDILEQATPQQGGEISTSVLERLRRLAEEALARRQSLIEQRAQRGLTRDGHGDLHLDHVYFFPDAAPPDDLVIVDCIEFNERLRAIDPVADMAFAVMDLNYRGRRDLARICADTYFAAARDTDGQALLPLYAAYRAMVRGLVEGMKRTEPEVPDAERAGSLQSARAHWLLALGELEEPRRRPCLVLVGGLPGAGKSTLARHLAGAANFTVIRSDVVRKELATTHATPDGLYTPAWDERTYAECLRRAESLLLQGQRVLVDASFREEKRRRLFLDAARRWAVPAALLVCSAEPATVRQRLLSRHNDASDAGWPVYLQIAAHWEEPGPATRRHLQSISSEAAPPVVQERALDVLRDLGLS